MPYEKTPKFKVEVVGMDGETVTGSHEMPSEDVDLFVMAMDCQMASEVRVTAPDGRASVWRWHFGRSEWWQATNG